MKFWLVNQGTSFEEEKDGGFIYAPKTNSKGSTFAHWSDVKEVKKGDVIFCNKKERTYNFLQVFSFLP